jgi:diguanylate cyclase (GGDEF)-like protein
MVPATSEQCFRFFAEIVQALKSANQHEPVLALIVDRLVRIFKCQTCAVVLIDPKTDYLRIDNFHGLSQTFCNAFRSKLPTAAIGQLFWTGKAICISDVSADPTLAGELHLERPFSSCIAVQIAVHQRTLGYLHLDRAGREGFDDEDVKIAQVFADLAGLAIAKSRLFDENLRLERVDRETGLEKYVPFLEKTNVGLERAKAFDEKFCLLLMDIDDFKRIMNVFGYESSRLLLKEMGDTIRAFIRPVDAAGRYGFDEFILMLAHRTLEEALDFARSLLNAIATQEFTPRKIKATVSMGLAAYPKNGNTIEELITTAKKALFEAQKRGKNDVFNFDSVWYARELVS